MKLMTNKGLLEANGHGRGMRYYLPQGNLNILREDTTKVATSDMKSGNLDGAKVATSDVKSGNLDGAKVATSQKKKLSRDELQLLIMEHCTEWVSLDDLATMIGRNAKYLRNQIIPIMLAARKIQMMYPATPNNPKQQYKVVD